MKPCEFCSGSVDHKSLGAKLKAEREARGLSQKEVAIGMGITPAHLCALEQGKRSWTSKLRDAFLAQCGDIL